MKRLENSSDDLYYLIHLVHFEMFRVRRAVVSALEKIVLHQKIKPIDSFHICEWRQIGDFQPTLFLSINEHWCVILSANLKTISIMDLARSFFFILSLYIGGVFVLLLLFLFLLIREEHLMADWLPDRLLGWLAG